MPSVTCSFARLFALTPRMAWNVQAWTWAASLRFEHNKYSNWKMNLHQSIHPVIILAHTNHSQVATCTTSVASACVCDQVAMSRYFNGDGSVKQMAVRGPVGGAQEYSVFGWADRRMSNSSIPETTMRASLKRTGPTQNSVMKPAGTRTLSASADVQRPARAYVLLCRLSQIRDTLVCIPTSKAKKSIVWPR